MTDYDRIAAVIRHLHTNHREQPSVAELAALCGLGETRFHQLFLRWAGTTPKAFLKFLTAEHAKELLRESRDLLGVSLDVGLSGPGRLHDLLVTCEAVTPGEWKARGAGVDIRWGVHETPFGDALVGRTARGVCHLAFTDDRGRALEALASEWPESRLIRDPAATRDVAASLFVRRAAPTPVHLRGTPFQLKVWQALLRVPSGRAVSYTALAEAIGRPKASRAVGSAVARNGIAFLIPCHRVIRESGLFGEYRWGIERKRALLAWESAQR